MMVDDLIWPDVSWKTSPLGADETPTYAASTAEWLAEMDDLVAKFQQKLVDYPAQRRDIDIKLFHLKIFIRHIARISSSTFGTATTLLQLTKCHASDVLNLIKSCRAVKLAFPGPPTARLVILHLEKHFLDPSSELSEHIITTPERLNLWRTAVFHCEGLGEAFLLAAQYRSLFDLVGPGALSDFREEVPDLAVQTVKALEEFEARIRDPRYMVEKNYIAYQGNFCRDSVFVDFNVLSLRDAYFVIGLCEFLLIKWSSSYGDCSFYS